MIAELETHILMLIDNMVDTAGDDDLFASGYLRGHLTLAVAELEHRGLFTPEALYAVVNESLEKAIQAGELAPRDRLLVTEMWHQLWQQANIS